MKKIRNFKVREIVYKKDNRFLAVSLDLDLMAEGKTMGRALDRLHDATVGYLLISCEDNEPDEEIYRKAPKKYFQLYELFKELDEKRKRKDKIIFAGEAKYDYSELIRHA